jgi:heme oxygenase (biliverdin-IX-beta and delta-forming)
MNDRAPDGIMAQLRAATRREHAAIEATTFGRALLHGEVDAPAYAGQLAAYLQVHESLARHAWLHLEEPRSWLLAGTVQRARQLRLDLASLRVKRGLDGALSGALRRSTEALVRAIDEASFPAALGAAYVFEGSAMGNRQLAPALTRSLSLAEDESAYYRGHGARAGQVFRAFAHEMDKQVVDEGERHEACRGAVLVFSSLVAVFDGLSATSVAQDEAFTRAPAA